MFGNIISNEELKILGNHENDIKILPPILTEFQKLFQSKTIEYSKSKGRADEDDYRNNYRIELDEGLETTELIVEVITKEKSHVMYLPTCLKLINKLSEEIRRIETRETQIKAIKLSENTLQFTKLMLLITAILLIIAIIQAS